MKRCILVEKTKQNACFRTKILKRSIHHRGYPKNVLRGKFNNSISKRNDSFFDEVLNVFWLVISSFFIYRHPRMKKKTRCFYLFISFFVTWGEEKMKGKIFFWRVIQWQLYFLLFQKATLQRKRINIYIYGNDTSRC